MRYAMIIEPGERNYSAYLPDLPGCVATGKTIEELRQRMRGCFHSRRVNSNVGFLLIGNGQNPNYWRTVCGHVLITG